MPISTARPRADWPACGTSPSSRRPGASPCRAPHRESASSRWGRWCPRHRRATREFTALAELLAAVEWGKLDRLLVDLPPGAERTFQYAEFLGERTSFVLVTLPSDLSRGVVARSVAALRDAGNPVLGYIENMSGYWCRDCGELRPLFPDTGAVDLGIPCLGRVPFDPELAAMCDRGEPLPEEDAPPSATALREIAARIDSELEND
jgi:MinD-like ATPase involved in chromosome partitioning or flagellar assembly